MKDNKDIISESFFKKMTYAEKQQQKMPQYAPIEVNNTRTGANGSSVAIPVTDTNELKKRLTGTYGVAFGKNSVKSMASKAVKTFPIIVSDKVAPETVLMLKRDMEDQYAEYINLLISNQVVDLSQYRSAGNDGDSNIAIQALDTISGTDFSKSRIADTAASGKLTADDVFANTPLYALLKEEKPLKTGESIVDSLLEGAMVVDSKDAKKAVNYLQENAALLEMKDIVTRSDIDTDLSVNDPTTYHGNYTKNNNSDNIKLSRYMMDIENGTDNDIYKAKNYANRTFVNDVRRGYHGIDDDGNEVLTSISSADIVLNKKRMDQAVNRSIGEMLSRPENYEIRDKFEKATFLLQSRRISGMEYYQYLTIRLGIPVSDDARIILVRDFKASDVVGDTYAKGKDGNPTFKLTDEDQEAITHNRAIVSDVVKKTCSQKIKDCMSAMAPALIGATAGAGTGALTTFITRAARGMIDWSSKPVPDLQPGALNFFANWAGPSLAYAAVGASAGVIVTIVKAIKARITRKDVNSRRIEGWERVEALINAMDQYQAEVRLNTVNPSTAIERNNILNKNSAAKYGRVQISTTNTGEVPNPADIYAREKRYMEKVALLTEGQNLHPTYSEFSKKHNIKENVIQNEIEDITAICEDIVKNNSKELDALEESSLLELSRSEKLRAERKSDDINITPNFMARNRLAYGSTEIERRDNKDRRFNQPLIITVKFKERMDDGKYSDNELTAVIGILGKVIIVPTEEMEYILKENTQGSTVEGIFKGDNDLKNAVSDILATSKITKDMKNLPVSADVWANLEKVTTLAAANKISGKRNNNISNAHIVFDVQEINDVKVDTGVDYLRDSKKVVSLMKRYSAFTLMIADDTRQKLYVFDDQDSISWNLVPYTALTDKGSGSSDQNLLALARLMQR